MDYTTERGKSIQKWAKKQVERLTEAVMAEEAGSERQNELSDVLITARLLLKKADSVVEGDNSLQELGGETETNPVEEPKANNMGAANTADTVDTVESAQPEAEIKVEEAVQDAGKIAALTREQPKGTEYIGRNQVADNLTQSGGKEESASTNPLVKVKDFWSQIKSGAVQFKDFLKPGQTITAPQQQTIRKFSAMFTKWAPTIDANLPTPVFTAEGEHKYALKDMMQYMVTMDGKPTLDENVKLALSYGAFNWITDAVREPRWLNNKQLNSLLGIKDKKNSNFTADQQEFRDAGETENNVTNSIGKAIVQALGLRAKPNAPLNILPQLESALGAHAVNLLVQEGFMVRKTWQGEVLSAVFKKPITKAAEYNFVKLAYANSKDSTLTPAAQSIKEATKGNGGILSKLFSVDTKALEPTFEPQKVNQKNTKNGDRGIPESILKAMQQVQDTANFIREDVWNLYNDMGVEGVAALAGSAEEDASKVHAVNRLSNKAKNDNLRKEYENFMEYGETALSDNARHSTALHLQAEAWVHQRLGITTNYVNPQTSKIVRHAVTREGWRAEVKFDNSPESVAMLESFKLRVAEGLGVKVENQSIQASLDQVAKKLEDPAIAGAIEALRQRIYERKGEATDSQRKAILAGTKKAGEKMFSFDALVAMAHHNQAKLNNKDGFATELVAEIDGKTNGPMLSILLLGAGYNQESLGELLQKGGFYSNNQEHTQYSGWKESTNGQDLYETTGGSLIRGVNPKDMAILEKFVGKLVDGAGAITSAGRNFIKTPLTALMFGSSIQSAQKAIADKVIESLYKRIETVNSKPTSEEVSKLLTDIKDLGVNFKGGKTIEELMEYEFKGAELEVLYKSIGNKLNDPLKAALEHHFTPFLMARDSMNLGANVAFVLYKGIYDGLRQSYIEAMITDGSMPVVQKGLKAGQPIRDLTKKEEKAFRQQLEGLMPVMHTAASQAEGNIDNGMFIGKNASSLSPNDLYESEVKFAPSSKLNSKGKPIVPSKTVRAQTVLQIPPGVRAMILSIHSSDSAISQWAAVKGNVLNIHDAHATGLNDFTQVGKNLNAATWEVMLNYSPIGEAYSALSRTVLGIAGVLNNKDTPESVKKSIAQSLANFMGDKKNKTEAHDIYSVKDAVESLFSAALIADTNKLTFLANTKAIDQYPTHDGNFEPTSEDRGNAQAKLNTLPQKVDSTVLNAAEYIDSLLGSDVKAQAFDMDGQVIDDLPTASEDMEYTDEDFKALSIRDLHVFNLSSVETARVLEVVLSDSAWAKTGEAILEQVRAGVSLSEVVLKTLGRDKAVELVLAMGAASRNMDGGEGGKRGMSAVRSDPAIVDFFEQNPNANGKQVLEMLGKHIKPNTYSKMLMERLRRGLADNVKFQYVTAETKIPEGSKPVSNSRGWYATADNTVYVLSSIYEHSGLTTETILHELLHAALGEAIDNPSNPEAKAMVAELETLRVAAEKFMQANKLTNKYAAAVASVHELVSWGMTNRAFQRDVLNQVTVKPSKNLGNKYLTAAAKFFNTLASYLFKGNTDKNANGLMQLAQNVGGLFEYADQNAKGNKASNEFIHSMVSATNNPNNFTTTQVFEALGNIGNPASPEFSEHLKSVLGSVSERLFGAMGTFKETVQANLGIAPEDIYTIAAMDGKAEFATQAKAAGFTVTEQEAFVMDQVEAAVSAALHDGKAGTTYMATSRLSELYREAYRTLNKPEAFHQGDWATATAAEKANAVAMQAFVFKLNAGGKAAHLSRFAAMALAHEGFSQLLAATSLNAPKTAVKETHLTKMVSFFNSILDFFGDKVTNTNPSQAADTKVRNLVRELVKMEMRRKVDVARSQEVTLLDKGLSFGNTVVEAALSKLADGFNHPMFDKRKFIKAGVKTARIIGQGRGDELVEGITKIRDKAIDGKYGLIMGIFKELKSPNQAFLALLLGSKNIERQRKFVGTETAKFVRNSFANAGADLTTHEKDSLTHTVLRTGAHVLVEQFTPEEMQSLFNDKAAREAAITAWEAKIAAYPQARYYSNQAKALGHSMVHGQAKGPMMMLNATNIVSMQGMAADHGLSVAEQSQATEAVDVLTTLYSLKYSKSSNLKNVAKIMEKELARPAGEDNGIVTLMYQHKAMEKDARERIFAGEENQMIKGYMPEITNPHIEVEAVPEGAEMDALTRVGFVRAHPLPKDKADNDQTQRYLMVRKGAGLAPYQSGIVSLTSRKTKGFTLHNGSRSVRTEDGRENAKAFNTMMARKAAAEGMMLTQAYDPEADQDVHAAPVFNPAGEVVDFRYMMASDTRDSLLERTNGFDKLMGAMAGNTFDKEAAPVHNLKAIDSVLAFERADFHKNPNSYMEVGPQSKDPEMRQLWAKLPYNVRQHVKKSTGRNRIMVRNDMADLVFGYRKLSLGAIFDKQEKDRGVFEHAFAWAIEETLETYGKANKMSQAEVTALVQQAQVKVMQGERMWQEAVGMAKDNIVIKTVSVLVNNIVSNASLLRMSGVPFSDILEHHRVGYKATKQWNRDSEALFAAEQELANGNSTKSMAELQRTVDILKNALDTNPVKPLIDAGLMPTIVEDVGQESDDYSYKNKLSDYLEEKSRILNPTIVEGAKAVYMESGGKVYQTLSEITQMSDFVARYTLYQHMTTRKSDPLNHAQAVHKASEYFINYDVPMHRLMQYSDDMGITMFTKYFLRIQRVLATVARENPAQTLGMFLATDLLDLSGSVLESGVWTRLGNNPFHSGAFQLPGSVGGIATIDGAWGLIK